MRGRVPDDRGPYAFGPPAVGPAAPALRDGRLRVPPVRPAGGPPRLTGGWGQAAALHREGGATALPPPPPRPRRRETTA